MKKETVITAAVFLAVGFLAGYIYDSERNWSRQEQPRPSVGTPSAGDAVARSPAWRLPVTLGAPPALEFSHLRTRD